MTRFFEQISKNDANEHNFILPMQFIGKINSSLHPWKIMDFDLKNGSSGQMVLTIDLVDKRRLGATRINTTTGEKEDALGIRIDFPILDILPTKEEIDILIESARQDLGLKGTAKIYMGR